MGAGRRGVGVARLGLPLPLILRRRSRHPIHGHAIQPHLNGLPLLRL